MAPAATSTRTSGPHSLRPSINSTCSTAHQPVQLGKLEGSSSSSRTTPRSSITLSVSPPHTELKFSPEAEGTLPATSLPTSPFSNPLPASPYSSASRTTSHVAIPVFPDPGQPSVSTKEVDSVGQRLRKWLHIRTWWQGSIAIITLVIGVLGLVYSAYRSYNLARWTAAKDFYEQCHNAKVENQSISRECANTLSMGLAPPPYVYNDFFTTLTKRFLDTGYRKLDISKQGDAKSYSSPSSSLHDEIDECPTCFARDEVGEGLTRFTPDDPPSEMNLWWPLKFLIVLVPFLAGGGIVLFMYRKASKHTKVEVSPVRSDKPIKVIQCPPEGQYDGLRRRPRRTPSKVSDLSIQDFNTYEWHGDGSIGSGNMSNYVIEPSETASVRQVDHDNPDNRAGKLPSAWHISTEEEQKKVKTSHFKMFLQEVKRRPAKPPDIIDVTDVSRSRAVSEPHGTRGQGVFDLEQLKPILPSPPGQHQLTREHDLSCESKTTPAAIGVTLANPTNADRPAPEHAVGTFHLAASCERDAHPRNLLPGNKPKPKRDGAIQLGLAHMGMEMAASSGGGVTKSPLLGRERGHTGRVGNGDVLLQRVPQNTVTATISEHG